MAVTELGRLTCNMCDFISIGLNGNLTPALRKWRRRGYALAEHDHPALRKALPPSHVPWLLTTGGCSCDFCGRPSESVQTRDAKRAIVLRDDAAEIIRELVALDSGSSFLYVHFYGGDISTEPLPIVKRSRRTPGSLTSPTDPIMRDELIELTTRNQPKQG